METKQDKLFDISPDEWGWDLLTSELDDELFEALKKLSMFPDEQDEEENFWWDHDTRFKHWFMIAYNINGGDNKWERGKNHYDRVVKLLQDNGFKTLS